MKSMMTKVAAVAVVAAFILASCQHREGCPTKITKAGEKAQKEEARI